MRERITEGAAEPLGVTLDGNGANVAVFSAHAAAIDLCLFDESGVRETERIRLTYRTGDVFHAYVPGLREGQRYGLRAHGPFDPSHGHRFNAAKLLVDPYALALDRPFALHDSMFAYAPGDSNLSIDHGDSAAFIPKAIMTRVERADVRRLNIPWRDTIIYELHVKGFTKRHPDVPVKLRGTFAGLAHDAAIAHLKNLGVTTIELMPCAAWIDERHLTKLGLSNYWGYNPIAMMAPDPRLAPGGWAEVRDCVAKLRTAGLEVLVDVVLNHTGEGDELGPALSLRGLDNASYYRLNPDDRRRYVNDAGCGNVLASDRVIVVRYMMDALRAWAVHGGVDGFRFDLATTLARRPQGFDAQAPFLAAIAQDPVLRELKLVAEPWDIGPGGYQLGRFPANFVEWNDRFRDCARRFWRGDDIGVSELATRFAGSSDVFGKHRRPSHSVNFVTAHDGFTLADLVSYARKHNEANGEDNRDGTDDNASWNNGVEGASADPTVTAARARDQRNLLATLLLSRGTPMLSMGAECGQTQRGANNAYAQDNETTWLDWANVDAALVRFTACLTKLRKDNAALSRDSFLESAPLDATLIPDVEWLSPDGAPMREEMWRDGRASTLIASLYAPQEQGREANRVVVILNRGRETVSVMPPPTRSGVVWRLATTTASDAPSCSGEGAFAVEARSVALLVEEKSAAPVRRADPIPDDVLARLARAAGVETDWRDVSGVVHEVPRDTLTTLLANLGLPAQTLSQGRESLARLAQTQDRRALPQSAVFREGEDIVLRLAAVNGRVATGLRVDCDDRGRLPTNVAPALEAVSWLGVDGRRCEGVLVRLPTLELGRYTLSLDDGSASCRLAVAPAACYLPQDDALRRGAFGLSAQLYSLRRQGDQGVGDFATLAETARLAASQGAALLALNPLHALFARDRERASPYYPSDRRFLDPLYVDLHGLAEFFAEDALRHALQDEERLIAALAATSHVDYPGVHALKQRIFERAFAAFADLAKRHSDAPLVAGFHRFVAQGGETLWRFACFETISEARGGESWRLWPSDLREGRQAALEAFAGENAARIEYHRFLQFLCDRQFGQAAAKARDAGLVFGFCRDLAVGAAPDGAESWGKAASLVTDFSVGAPPDPFSREGQAWGLPPPNPLVWKADGCADFAELCAANMRCAGALRIDHVMGLARLFVVPSGAKASDGAYLAYPRDDLLGQLAIESHCAKCLVVGEDLGTLPWGFREELDAANVLSYRVLWFERDGTSFAPPAHYAKKAMACVSTHDLPTLAGWWAGADIVEKTKLGLLTPDLAEAENAARRADKAALIEALRREGLIGAEIDAGAAFDDALARALHVYAARTPSFLAMAQVDDLAGEVAAVNLPGTDRQRPNWRRKLRPLISDLFATSRAQAILGGLRRNVDEIATS